MAAMLDWFSFHPAVFWWLVVLSGLVFVASLILVPIVIGWLPRDYFLRERPITEACRQRHWVIRWLLLIGKNLLGLLLLLGGLAMLPGPGQGTIVMLLGFMLLDFPGKRQVELRILRRPMVERVVNWIRRRRGREPLLFPPKTPRRRRKVIATSPKRLT